MHGGVGAFGIGIAEMLAILMIGVIWLIPVACAVWVLVTLQRIRTSQQNIHERLNAIEQLLQRR